MSNHRIHAWRVVVGLVVLTAVGCGKDTGNVAGMVRFKDQPLPQGRIVFYCQGGEKPVLMSAISEGAYSIREAPIGAAKVTIETFEIKTTRVPGQFSKGGSISSPIPEDQPLNTPAPTDELSSYVAIPDRYRAVDRSKLEVEIVDGDNTHDFNLEE